MIDRATEILAAARVALEAAYGNDELEPERTEALRLIIAAAGTGKAAPEIAFQAVADVFGRAAEAMVAEQGRAAA